MKRKWWGESIRTSYEEDQIKTQREFENFCSGVVIEPENNNRVRGDYLLGLVQRQFQLCFTEFVRAEPRPHELA